MSLNSKSAAKLKAVANRYNRHPAGASGGVGGRFAPKNKASQVISTGVPDYAKKKKLGAGFFGQVELTDRGTAVKAVSLSKIKKFLKKDAADVIQPEVDAYQELGELGVTPRLLSHDPIPAKGQTGSFRMELEFLADHKTMGGSKFPLPDNDRQQANMEAKCLKMHQAGWIHGDLHGENIMVGANDDIRIIDMGFAKKLNFDAPGITPAEVDSFTVYLFDDFERLRASDDSKIMPRYQALEADINAARNKYMNNRGQYPDEIRKKAVDEMRLAYNRFRSQ